MLHEIENLSFAELKAKQADLITEAAKAAPGELAARYVKARTDAKCRDEKLAEQAVTLAALTEGSNALTEKNKALAAEVSRLAGLIKEAQAMHGQLAAEKARADKAEALAKARRAVLARLMQDVSPLLAEEG